MSAAQSWLFVPGDSARKIERALQGDAHALIFDWEDAVAPAEKPAARQITMAALAAAGAPVERCWIRVNALSTPFFDDDIGALPGAAIAGVVLPKACGVRDIERLSAALEQLERTSGLAAGALRIVAIVTETAASVLALSEFRAPMPRLHAMLWGGEDLAADLGVANNRENRTDAHPAYRAPFQFARNLTLFAAAATECLAIDAVFTDVRAQDALLAESAAARADGFGAKAAIHPDQVAVINRTFAPTAEERRWAQQVIEALGQQQGGVAVLDGKMLDAPHLRLAKRILSR
ncbi:CoA ester lyase [Paraburkholderia fungorum]|uniref:HpcH/HpaI aldolase/citrate lyase family protein n=1 Tax=Paraburkholderia fungorum TaxID=134537 RepID=UPI0038B95840